MIKWVKGMFTDAGPPVSSPANLPQELHRSEWLPVLSARALFKELKVEGRIEQIRVLSAFPPETFNLVCLPALSAFAERVQLAPASEAHHHSGPGGMIEHTLEVVDIGLRLRKGYILPQGALAEEIMLGEHQWTYGVFVGALLHDIGKPIADHIITLDNGAVWSPSAGSLLQTGAKHYRIDFNRERQYHLHTQLAMTMLPLIVPTAGREWLAKDQRLMAQLTAWLYGDNHKAGALGEILVQADMKSVRMNLGAGTRVQLATAKEMPLVDKLLRSLRMLIIDEKLPLNRNGGAGWVYDGFVWLVCARAVNTIREQLLADGHGGIPTANDRVFDILAEHKACELTPTGHSVWHVLVKGDNYQHAMTVLKFHLSVLYSSPASYPKPMNGAIEVVDPASKGRAETPAPEPVPDNSPEAAADQEGLPAEHTGTATTGSSTTGVDGQAAANAGEPGVVGANQPGPVQSTSTDTPGPEHAAKPSKAEPKPKRLANRQLVGNLDALEGGETKATSSVAPAPTGTAPKTHASGGTKASTSHPANSKGAAATTEGQGSAAKPIHTPTPAAVNAASGSISPLPASAQDTGAVPGSVTKQGVVSPQGMSFESNAEQADVLGMLDMLSSSGALPLGLNGAPVSTPASVPPNRPARQNAQPSPGQAPVASAQQPARAPAESAKPPPVVGRAPAAPKAYTFDDGSGYASTAEAVIPESAPPPVAATPAKAQSPKVPAVVAPGVMSREMVPDANPGDAPQMAVDFMKWLILSLQSNCLDYNCSGAMVHFVADGMFLASPAIFKKFAATQSDVDWDKLQRAFTKTKWALREGDRNVFTYAIQSAKGSTTLRLHGVIVSNPGALLSPVPQHNPHLVRSNPIQLKASV